MVTTQVAGFYRFISANLRSLTTKSDMIVDQHALILPCMYDDVITTGSSDSGYQTFCKKTSNKQT